MTNPYELKRAILAALPNSKSELAKTLLVSRPLLTKIMDQMHYVEGEVHIGLYRKSRSKSPRDVAVYVAGDGDDARPPLGPQPAQRDPLVAALFGNPPSR